MATFTAFWALFLQFIAHSSMDCLKRFRQQKPLLVGKLAVVCMQIALSDKTSVLETTLWFMQRKTSWGLGRGHWPLPRNFFFQFWVWKWRLLVHSGRLPTWRGGPWPTPAPIGSASVRIHFLTCLLPDLSTSFWIGPFHFQAGGHRRRPNKPGFSFYVSFYVVVYFVTEQQQSFYHPSHRHRKTKQVVLLRAVVVGGRESDDIRWVSFLCRDGE